MIYNLLYEYQKKIVDSLKEFNSCALFMDVGTGKSITSLALFEHKKNQGKCSKLLIICLCAKINEWKYDCERWFPDCKTIVLNGKSKSKMAFDYGNFDIAIINFEKTWRNDDLFLVNKNYYIIVDESHKIKDSTTKVGKFMRQLAFLTPYKCILTATPMANGYIDIYNQLYFIGLLDISLDMFKEKYCNEQKIYVPGIGNIKKIVGYRNTAELDKLVKKYARYYERKIDDDLVPSEVVIPFDLDNKYYDIVRKRAYKDISISSLSGMRLILKSLCSGTIIGLNSSTYDGKINSIYQLNSDKLNWVKSFLEDFSERVVIFYMFNHQRDQLYDMVTKLKRPCARYCADYKEDDIFKENDNSIVLVQYKSGSTGIDWLKLSYISIFYCLSDSYIEFYQAKGRTNRVGQTKKPLYYLLVSKGNNSVDELNYNALINKQDFNDNFFAENFKNE